MPVPIAANTIARLMKITPKLIDCRTDSPFLSFPYAACVYMNRFSGRKPTLSKVDAVVIDTDKARSALSKLHHQLLYDPPGDELQNE